MNLPDLSQIYKILSWHQNDRDKKPGESVGLFIPIPTELAQFIPQDGKIGEDNSPPHITALYIGDYNIQFKEKLIKVLMELCSQIKPFKIKIGRNPRKFYDQEKNQTVSHLPVFSQKLGKMHYTFKDQLMKNMINVLNKHPEYKPHVTLEYVKEGQKAKYKKFTLDENKEFIVDSVWIWGLDTPIMIPLGKR